MSQKLDLDAIRAAAAGGRATDEVPVTKRWLRKALAELEASRSTFRSPIAVLTDRREGTPA